MQHPASVWFCTVLFLFFSFFVLAALEVVSYGMKA